LFHYFDEYRQLDLLRKVYGQIVTTPEIAAEFGEPFPEWVEIAEVKDKYRQRILELQIDRGESSVIALALETPYSIVIWTITKPEKSRNDSE
jgi:predicted nucleic acid-binding protein